MEKSLAHSWESSAIWFQILISSILIFFFFFFLTLQSLLLPPGVSLCLFCMVHHLEEMLRVISVMCLFVLTSVVLTCIQAHTCKHKHIQAEWQLMPSSCAEMCLVWWFRVLSVMRQTRTLTNDCDRQCCSNRDKGNGIFSSLLFQANGSHCLRLWVGLMPCSQMNCSFGRHEVNTGVSALWTPSRPEEEIHWSFCYKKTNSE